MISLENELAQLDPPPARLIAEERREIFSLFGELRVASYLAVALITTGVGIVIKNNADRIGPIAIITALLVVAAGCYAFALRKRERTIVGDYVLLLGALLASAAIGYAESQYHLLGDLWSWHLLLLALFHAATAYFFDSRLVLSASLTSLAAFFGVEKTLDMTATMGLRALLCAGIIVVWRVLNRHRAFNEVFDHFAATLAFLGALALSFDNQYCWIGVGAALILAVTSIMYGLKIRSEAFIVYGIVYGTIAIDVGVISSIARHSDGILIPFYLLVTTPIMIVVLFVTHLKMKGTTR